MSNDPGIELLLQGATPQLSSPLDCFTPEFGMESEWFQSALDTRKLTFLLSTKPFPYIATSPHNPLKSLYLNTTLIPEDKPSVY